MIKHGSFMVFLAAAAMVALPVAAQEHGGGGGGGGCGDVFGDLVHVLRDADTGQPILQKRFIEMPKELPGYGWGYCTVPVDENGEELGFAPYSCDIAEADIDRAVEVDYFGRLNGGRTKERNNRMHFNEVISTIAGDDVGQVRTDETGRLMLGYECALNAGGQIVCTEWAVVDSPMENMGLYVRLMKYGHFQTDPEELDPWFHGDPALGPQYHPALDYDDWTKFHSSVRHLLPRGGDAESCFPLGEDGVTRGFDPDCAGREALTHRDFTRAAGALAGAANKTGKATADLVQYFDRIVKIPRDTEVTVGAENVLPALVRECPATPDPATIDPEVDPEPVYDMDACTVVEADEGMVNYEFFPDVQETFVDFGAVSYERGNWRDEDVAVIRPDVTLSGNWFEDVVPLLGWLGFRNGPEPGHEVENLQGFIDAANDSIRSIEFVHNYAIPADLGWDFED